MFRALGDMQQPVLGVLERALASRKPPPLPVVYPQVIPPRTPTPLAELDTILQHLDKQKAAWAATSAKNRAKLLRACLKTTLSVFKEASQVATKAHGSYGCGTGEEMLSWMPVIAGMRELAESLEAGGQRRPNSVTERDDGQLVVDVFPLGLEGMLYGGCRGEVWIMPGHAATQGALYKRLQDTGPSKGAVSLVLGAGNQLPVAMLDIIHKLILEDSVVVCKMNPINEYLGPFVRRALQPLVDAGYVEVVYGGAEQGKYLCNHPLVADVHLTGSNYTYDAIVWGGKKDKTGDPPFPKPVFGELGCCTPYIIVPGEWRDADMEYQAEMILTGKLHNCGHNCLAAEILITDADWPQRQQFLDVLQRQASSLPQRIPYYPAAADKSKAFHTKFPDAAELGSAPENGVHADNSVGVPQPLLFQSGVAPDKADTKTENWGLVLQEVPLPNCKGNPSTFLPAAVEYANNKCWGTLSCAMFIDPITQRHHQDAYVDAIANLRYGSIAINAPGTLGFGITKLTWGAFPGHTPQDIQSGNCTVHNTMMLDHPQKSVLYVPWRYHPYPPWSSFNANSENIFPALNEFFAGPSLFRLLRVVPPALLG